MVEVTNKPPPSLLNQPSTPSERTREALRSIAVTPPQPEDRLTSQPTRTVTNIYSVGIQGRDGGGTCLQSLKILRQGSSNSKRPLNLGVPLDAIDAVMFDQAVNLHEDSEVYIAAEDIKRQDLKPDLLIWDTLFHTTLGADLTLPKDVLPIFRRARELMAKTGAHSGLMVHHTPKDGRGTFGSVAIPASVDVIIDSVASGPNTATVTNERMRRARVFDPIEITLMPVKVETLPDDEGVNDVDQLVVASSSPATAKPSKQTDQLEDMDLVLRTCLHNKATRTQWMTKMQEYGRGWSEANFDKKLAILKKQGRVIGGGAQGEYYSMVSSEDATAATSGASPDTQNYPQQKVPSPHSPGGMMVVRVLF
jgi:hypothetical protein